MSLFTDLVGVPREGRVGLLLRHADRQPVLAPQDFLAARLTGKGRRKARQFGRRLASLGWAVRAYHSPVPRCEQTAVEVALGAQAAGRDSAVVGPMEAIGGGYVRDPSWALKQFLEHGRGFIRDWLDGAVPADQMAPRAETTERHLASIAAVWNEAPTGTLLVFVTHDWNVLCVREELFGLRFEECGWVGYLEGLLLHQQLDDPRLEARYGGAVVELPSDGVHLG